MVAGREAGVNSIAGGSLSGHDAFSAHAHIIIGCCAGTFPCKVNVGLLFAGQLSSDVLIITRLGVGQTVYAEVFRW